MRHKLSATGIDTLKRGGDLLLLAQGTDALRRLRQLAIAVGEQGRNTRVCKAILLGTHQRRVR